MTTNKIGCLLQPVFEKYKETVVFAYLFGSAACDTGYPPRDVDIAVFFSEQKGVSYYDTALSLHADFCRVLKRSDVDMVVLNTATNMMLLDEIVRHGAILFDRDPEIREEFELKVVHRFIDFKEQRKALLGV